MKPNHTDRTHARLSASKLESVALCPGKLLLEEQCPDPPASEAAAYGTLVHEIAEAILSDKPLPENITHEQHDEAKAYIDTAYYKTPNAKKRHIELDVTEALKTIHPSLGGTADFVAIGGGELVVGDLKTGRHKVEPQRNPQLLTYALGAALHLNAPDHIKIRLAIYQNEWKEWETDMSTLKVWANDLIDIATNAHAENAPLNPGEKQCQFCRAKAICPALKEKAMQDIRADFNINAMTITPELLNQAKLAELWSASVIDAAKDQIIAGTPIIGWRMKEGRRMKTWINDEMASEALKTHPEAFMLRSVAGVLKAGIKVPDGLINETRTAASLVRDENSANIFDDIAMDVDQIPVKPTANIGKKPTKKEVQKSLAALEAANK